MGGECGMHRKGKNFYKVGKLKGKRLLGRPRCRWENGIRMDLREIGWEDCEWVHLAQDRGQWQAVMNVLMSLRVLAPQS
jgi:hypothetical protein